ncbi:MAG: acyl-CoA synthetase [Pseudomonadales bacterium]|jgi:fatty-acyl-CoA synthase|nr:acyl-CoA synthetase [Pseudomonadales bacterium]
MSVSSARRQTLGDLLRRSARRAPGRTALACGDVHWSYSELDSVVDRLARGLRGIGVGVGDKVAVLARNSHAFIAMRFAIARAGAVLVPVNFMLNADELGYILGHSQARVLCTDSGLAELARAAAAKGTHIDKFVWLPGEAPGEPCAGMIPFDALLEPPAVASGEEPDLHGGMLAQILYTSGTESLPKGAMLTHESVIAQYVSVMVAAEYSAGDTMLHAMPLFHCAQLDTFFGPMLYNGASNVITASPTPESVLPKIGQFGITSLFAPPTVWIALLRSPMFDHHDLSSLRKCYYGASIMPVAILQEMQQRLPGARFWNIYGQTEIAPTATVLPPEDQIRKAGSAGKPVLNVETIIVDEACIEMPRGTVGEIVHRSPQLLTGYFLDEAKTAEAFAGGWFHSGDLGVMDEEGYITVVDRKKDMIKTGGENVASREVEECIYRLPAVSEVAVVALSDPCWVEAVTAVVVVKDGEELDESTVIAHCTAHLAHFKCPKRVIFTDSLPRNPSGKILKRDLRARYEHTTLQVNNN